LVVFCENEIQGFVQSHYTVYAGNIFSWNISIWISKSPFVSVDSKNANLTFRQNVPSTVKCIL
jgi:hypothetical protein